MKKLFIGIVAVALLASAVSPTLAGGGYSGGQTAAVGVTVDVLEYYKIWVSPTSVTLDMDPGNSWIGTGDVTLSYYACIGSSTSAPIEADFEVAALQSGITMWLKLYDGATKIAEWHVTSTGSHGPTTIASYAAGDPIQHDTVTVHANVGTGIPVTSASVCEGTLTFTIATAV